MTRRSSTTSLAAYAASAVQQWSPIVVTNRAPYQQVGDNRLKRAPGGVVTAMLAVAEATGATWIACATNPSERALAASGTELTVGQNSRRPFKQRWAMTDSDAYAKHYGVIANPLLWFLQHYLWPLAYEPSIDHVVQDAWTNGYVAVNRRVAEATVAAATTMPKPPLVLFQDYHLYLAPRFVRESLPNATLQHFVHIPWPTPQYWTVLPNHMRRSIIDGLLACDVIGFQTERDVRNFLACCEELLGLRVDHRERAVLSRGRISWVRAYPVSIDADALRRLAASGPVAAERTALDKWRTEKLILRVDRIDPIKNIIRGFHSFERMLDVHPELCGKVTFWAFLQPSRQDIPAYARYLDDVRDIVAKVNARFANQGWQPIRLELRESLKRAIAAYASFDVLLVNSIYDGMNLVAKEGALLNEVDGALVLSENVGASQELGAQTLPINPFDVGATADALYEALTMPVEARRRRLAEMRTIIERHDVSGWLQRQLVDIKELIPRPAPQIMLAIEKSNGHHFGSSVRRRKAVASDWW